MAARLRYPPEIIEQAKSLWLKGDGDPNGVGVALSIPAATVRTWAMKQRWGPFGGTTTTLVDEVLTVTNLLEKFTKQAKLPKEADYDEGLANIAYTVPVVIGKLTWRELIDKADKVARLVELSRKILGKDDQKNGRSAFSVNFLAGGAMPPRIKQVELIESQQVVETAE